MSAWLLVPLVFCAMFAQDVLAVLMVQAEAQYRAHRAGLLDMASEACKLTTTLVNGGTVLLGHNVPLAAATVAASLAADYIGTRTGVQLGERLDKRRPAAPAQRLSVTFDGGREQEFAAWLRKQIRIDGGGPL